jgi:hypothetical protein
VLTSKKNTKQGRQNKHNQSKKENGPIDGLAVIWLKGLLLRLSLLCQFQVRLNGGRSTQQGVASMGLAGMVRLSGENIDHIIISHYYVNLKEKA